MKIASSIKEILSIMLPEAHSAFHEDSPTNCSLLAASRRMGNDLDLQRREGSEALIFTARHCALRVNIGTKAGGMRPTVAFEIQNIATFTLW